MTKPSKRQLELQEYVHELDYVAIIDALSKLIGIPLVSVLERLGELTDRVIESPIEEIVDVSFPDGIKAWYFNIWARRLELSSEAVTKQYLHFSDEYLESMSLSRALKISTVSLQVDGSNRVEEIVVRISERVNLIESLSQFYTDVMPGMGFSGSMAVPTIEYKLTENSGISLPTFILDPAYRQPFNVRLYALGKESLDVVHAKSFIEQLDQSVSEYPIRKARHA
ncbi:hypothetical protein [Reinekea sp. G2M2-21]|uniref:hypothetical protein n=1 Tax=Reinekea sp. G2M2-21 TaxID=2788942 RepID=UPI0018A8FE5E|nr:hypothetical protein [Reinekea sp. G2M2-21]